jgi:hypothetical protein
MARTQTKGTDVGDGSVCRVDLNVSTSGQAVITRILEVTLSGIRITSSTGADTGTGDVKLGVDLAYLSTQYAAVNHGDHGMAAHKLTSTDHPRDTRSQIAGSYQVAGSYAALDHGDHGLAIHAALTTTAHGLGASAFHPDNYFALYNHGDHGLATHAALTATAHGLGASAFHPDNYYAPTVSPTFSGTVAGISASMVGLGNVSNNAQWHATNHPTTLSGYGITDTPWTVYSPSNHQHDFSQILDNVGNSVAANTISRSIIKCNLITNTGYVSRAGIGLKRLTDGWGSVLLSVGINDAGTSFTDFEFNAAGNIISPSGTFWNAGNFNPSNYLLLTGGTIGSSRPVNIADGVVTQQGAAGGWALEYAFKGSAGTNRGGFGMYGGGDVMYNFYIGTYAAQLLTIDINGSANFPYAAAIQNHPIWHTGNFSPSNYLPLTGGTLTGSLSANGITLTGTLNSTTTNSNFISGDLNIGFSSYQGYKLAVYGTGYFAGAVTAVGTLTIGSSFRLNGFHGANHALMLPAAANGAGTGEIGLFTWISEPGLSWTGAGIARNISNTGSTFPRVNTSIAGQMVHFQENGNIDFVLETVGGVRTIPLLLTSTGNVGQFSGAIAVAGAISATSVRINDVVDGGVPVGENGGKFSMLAYGSYGLIGGVKGSGNAWLQVQRVDGGTSLYDLELQPNGGNVVVSGNLRMNIIDGAINASNYKAIQFSEFGSVNALISQPRDGAGMLRIDLNNSSVFGIFTGGTRRFYMDASGNTVFTGSTNVTGNATINGSIAANTFSFNCLTTSGGVTLWGGSQQGGLTWDTNYAKVYSTGSNALYIGSGSGTVTVQSSLTIEGNTRVGNVIQLGSNATIATYGQRGIWWHSDTSNDYGIYKPEGDWPKPLHIAFATGIKLAAGDPYYGGTKFYTSSAMNVELMSVGNGDLHVRIANNLIVTGTVTAGGGGYNSSRHLKNINEDWKVSAVESIGQFKIRDFNYKTTPTSNRTLGFIIDEIPECVADYVLFGENKDAINLYSLHALSFQAHQETFTEVELLKQRVAVLEETLKIYQNGMD